ncbi:ktr system potassium uptake protein B [Halolactibacillus alkaliphilus]|uniref:Ktr system potassium uptake protein B n=1 Tax=Halolactibacillus alkaliphilus TaxID=442899 RepID=A0A511X2J0_9BACI|nr:TrkH family potassium uptake protein [Halolactibacillus alkaliphilus]GEN57158.1 ktr system potassium uptake protein B [Halolactibacillus alkaliphilus]GGN72218.1 ktr system potassium uptake protein B [Halolactibacillus alkaliphilus]SFO88449.1 trk system potassium uptake protein TrkH [Halolactibacillus alkaliphilus]
MNLRLKLRDKPLSPPQILAFGFITIITLGTVLLMLPISRTVPLSWLDAFFTATSAVTVTGLIVVDTGTAFTTFGQTILMILIQIGGLGFLTFAVMSILFLGKKIRLKERILMQEALNQNSMGGIVRLIRSLFYFAISMELIATALLSIRWIPEYGISKGLFISLFHAVSSFNNAGFSLFNDSLSQYAADPLINIVITLLFVSGGIGFTVIYELMHKKKWRTWTLHTKIMLIGTFLINIFAILSFFILEMNNPHTIGAMPLNEQLWGSFFQGLTPRTAGFNSLDYGDMNNSTLMLTIFLMFIGAGSASTASGIKVTTLIIIILAVFAYLRGRNQVFAFRQRIETEVVIRSLSIIVISFFIVFVAIFMLSVTEDLPMMAVVFEAFSAFGTVGLSVGITDQLSSIGKPIIMFLMFIGRVGPLTIAFSLARSKPPHISYPKGEIFTG